ncbi:hypothetical protein SAMN05216345_101877 [Cupriavidus sp. YR651]|uniref:hypothetical protein n=1 Tax=Cupriavidus sp. YR651 TaxID=1855315 RepID=UPI0008916327|nr:hypothetical protein [Cupriavidus sp. YR651]SDC19435.1 hypothetical protein SAMN05216345_101877 [Cupriavidus sp. YR651]
MDPLTLTIALEDDSPGYEITPARVPLSVLSTFATDVKDFLKGSGKEVDPDTVEVAVVHGSLAVQARNVVSPSLVHDLEMLQFSADLGRIDSRRRTVMQRWQAAAKKKGAFKIKISSEQLQTTIAITNRTNFQAELGDVEVMVERYVKGEVVDLGGATQSNAHIKLPDGKTLVVRTDRDKIRAETENHLYKQVHLRIQAKLNIETGELSDAVLIEFVHYAPRFDEASFDRLTQKGEQVWGNVDDPAEWVRKLRGGN